MSDPEKTAPPDNSAAEAPSLLKQRLLGKGRLGPVILIALVSLIALVWSAFVQSEGGFFGKLSLTAELRPERQADSPATGAGPSTPEELSWILTGYARIDGEPVEHVKVWGQAGYSGRLLALAKTSTDEEGRFEFRFSAPQKMGTLKLWAEKEFCWCSPYTRQAEFVHDLNPAATVPVKSKSLGTQVFHLLVAFVALLVLAFFLGLYYTAIPIDWPREKTARLKYKRSLILTMTISISVVAASAVFQFRLDAHLNDEESRGKLVSLGIAYVSRGTYVADQEPQLIVSLTSPGTAKNSDSTSGANSAPITTGVGAPLWVIFLGTIGAAALAVQLIIEQITDPPEYLDKTHLEFEKGKHAQDLRDRCRRFVEQQFYAVSTPLAAILVYQLLVKAGNADSTVSVAIVMLGSSVAVAYLLQQAQTKIAQLFPKTADPAVSKKARS